MALPGQIQLVLLITVVALPIPSIIGVVAAWEGEGHFLWCGAAAALALTALGLAASRPRAIRSQPRISEYSSAWTFRRSACWWRSASAPTR